MIGIVATLNIKEGSGADFEAVAKQLVEKVNANEDGVVYYDLYKENGGISKLSNATCLMAIGGHWQ